MITVITPTLPDRGHLLAECRASVAALGLPHLAMCDTAGEGPAVIRNRLIGNVETEWTLFLDDDDLLFPNYVDAVAPLLPDADVVYTAWQLSGAIDPVPLPTFNANLLRQRNFIPVTACVRTSALRLVGGFQNVELEDHALWLDLLDAGCRFRYSPVIAWHYRRFPGSRTEEVA